MPGSRGNWRPALANANTVRLRAAGLHRALRIDPALLAAVLADPAVARRPVGDVLEWLPRYGPYRVEALLRDVEIRWDRLCGALTDRQRALLAAEAARREAARRAEVARRAGTARR